MSDIILRYLVKSEFADIQSRAESLLLEQAVELPRTALFDPWVLENIVGKILNIEEKKPGHYEVKISHPLRTTALDPAQLLNVAFGNSSLQPDVELIGIEVPSELVKKFGGPQFGISGLREKLDIPHRAITCTALKPMGLSPEKIGELAYTFSVGGLDIIKDDHGLADHDFCPFEKRVEEAQKGIARAAKEGHKTIYVPNLIGTPETVFRQLKFAKDHGVGAVMISPILVGPATLLELAQKSGLPILAHPSFGGASRIAPEVLLATIFKWFGADAIIYPHSGGRFSYSRETCLNIAAFSRSQEHGLKGAFPVPAGGIKTSRVREVLEFYGTDTILLVGGSLLEAGDKLLEKTQEFVQEVHTVSKDLEKK